MPPASCTHLDKIFPAPLPAATLYGKDGQPSGTPYLPPGTSRVPRPGTAKKFPSSRLGPEDTLCYSKAKVFVMGRYADPTEKAIRCPLKGHQRPLLACLACRHFPCRAMTEERLALLRTSPFVQLDTKNSKLLPRRHVMYIFRMTSGELRDAPEDFSPDAPDFEQLADVEEVLVIGKVLVKQLRLVAAPGRARPHPGTALHARPA